uniref:CCHC-type domain-containing protein n=1 Tax=Nelumbo nucifera TaxID=4432 RepID=A0A822XS96_NELNU|nr:TPA_asm: hypothetical protein HUJ06_024670 [Nelumbo nucifera]
MIGNDFFLIIFSSQRDYDKVLKNGPWMVNGKYLVLVPWKPGFNPLKAKLESVDIWVRLPGLPIECWSRDDLEVILQNVGEVLKLDDTIEMSRTLYLRICVRVNLTKPFILEIPLTSEEERNSINVFYENFFDLCINCGWRGHKAYECPKAKQNVNNQDGWVIVNRRKKINFHKKVPSNMRAGVPRTQQGKVLDQ